MPFAWVSTQTARKIQFVCAIIGALYILIDIPLWVFDQHLKPINDNLVVLNANLEALRERIRKQDERIAKIEASNTNETPVVSQQQENVQIQNVNIPQNRGNVLTETADYVAHTPRRILRELERGWERIF